MTDFGASKAALQAAAIINGDIPDITQPNNNNNNNNDDIFGDEESDDDFGLSAPGLNIAGDDRLGAAPLLAGGGGDDDTFGIAGAAPKKKRIPRPKLDANVLSSEQHGLGALLNQSKRLLKDTGKISSAPGQELKSLQKIMNEYRSFAKHTFGSVGSPAFYEKCEKLGGGAQVRSLMDLLRYRVTRGEEEGESGEDDLYNDMGMGVDGSESSSSSSSSSTGDDGIGKLTDEELRARIARNRTAALERLKLRNAEKAAQQLKEAQFTERLAAGQNEQDEDEDMFGDSDDDALFGAIDLDAIVQQGLEKRAAAVAAAAAAAAAAGDDVLQQHSQEGDGGDGAVDMMELSEDEDDLVVEKVSTHATVVDASQSQGDLNGLRYEESQEFLSQAIAAP